MPYKSYDRATNNYSIIRGPKEILYRRRQTPGHGACTTCTIMLHCLFLARQCNCFFRLPYSYCEHGCTDFVIGTCYTSASKQIVKVSIRRSESFSCGCRISFSICEESSNNYRYQRKWLEGRKHPASHVCLCLYALRRGVFGRMLLLVADNVTTM